MENIVRAIFHLICWYNFFDQSNFVLLYLLLIHHTSFVLKMELTVSLLRRYGRFKSSKSSKFWKLSIVSIYPVLNFIYKYSIRHVARHRFIIITFFFNIKRINTIHLLIEIRKRLKTIFMVIWLWKFTRVVSWKVLLKKKVTS